MLKKRFRPSLFVRPACALLAATLSGCLELSIPLSTSGEVPLDENLLGTWSCTPGDDQSDAHAIMRIVPFDDVRYEAEWAEGDDVTRYRAHGSRIVGATVFNVQVVEEDEAGSSWVFFQYRFESADALRLWVVRKESVRGGSETEKLDFVRQHASSDELYDPFALCQRAEREVAAAN